MSKKATCPRCGKEYDGYPALSRTDNATSICDPCGTAEALEDFMGTPLTSQAQWVGR